MRRIEGEFWTHCAEPAPESSAAGSSARDRQIGLGDGSDLCKRTAKEVASSAGYPVRSFRELVEHVAELGYLHRWRNLLYRGQRNDRRDKSGQTALFPSIYRPPRDKKVLSARELECRFELLDCLAGKLRDLHFDITSLPGMVRFQEYQLALLQHYELCPTPLTDLTHSLRVAASFALLEYAKPGSTTPPGNNRAEGFVYVVGLPHPHGSLSYFMDERLVLLKLQTFCPPQALRPHFQEGYLVGALPYSPKRQADQNLSRRMVAKYRLVNDDGNFWGRGFDPIPTDALLPEDDPFGDELKELLS